MKAICFPYAGGGSSAFARWATRAGDISLEVLPWSAQVPRDSARGRMPEVVERVARTILGTYTGPYVLVGASAGARVAYLVAEWLSKHAPSHTPRGVTLLTPPLPGSGPELEDLLAHSDLDLVRRLKKLGGIPKLEGISDEALSWMVGSTRRQLELIAEDRLPPRRKGSYQVRLALGFDDPLVPVDVCHLWLRALGPDCQVSVWPGGHFFWKTQTSVYEFAMTAGKSHAEN